MIIDNHKQINNYLDTSEYTPGTTSVINQVKRPLIQNRYRDTDSQNIYNIIYIF